MLQTLVDEQPDMKLLYLLDEQIKLATLIGEISTFKEKIAT